MMNINLLPKKSRFEIWYTWIWTGSIALLTFITLFSFYLFQTSIREKVQLEQSMSTLQNKEKVYTEMTEQKRYVFYLRQLKEEASLLAQESVDWLPVLQTIQARLPYRATIDSVNVTAEGLTLAVSTEKRADVAKYVRSLRTSPLFEDVFSLGIQSSETGFAVSQLTVKLDPSFYKGGKTP
jgi:Tfp pilus assembly protein PilN